MGIIPTDIGHAIENIKQLNHEFNWGLTYHGGSNYRAAFSIGNVLLILFEVSAQRTELAFEVFRPTADLRLQPEDGARRVVDALFGHLRHNNLLENLTNSERIANETLKGMSSRSLENALRAGKTQEEWLAERQRKLAVLGNKTANDAAEEMFARFDSPEQNKIGAKRENTLVLDLDAHDSSLTMREIRDLLVKREHGDAHASQELDNVARRQGYADFDGWMKYILSCVANLMEKIDYELGAEAGSAGKLSDDPAAKMLLARITQPEIMNDPVLRTLFEIADEHPAVELVKRVREQMPKPIQIPPVPIEPEQAAPIILQSAAPGRPKDPSYDEAFARIQQGENDADVFEWFCQANGISSPDKQTRDAFKAAIKRRQNIS